ncbi:transcription antitermination factor NusB [Ruminococcus sp. HUN007]|uniref:transcription antitermination factor NusB n=1 Tax=Ruminococcus sp. HUN007 TaxID=1514668 RepID=UPI0005D2B3F9|nr:transcription antitermination factor NusB [Ruminococcus sp. HUN007]
MADKLTRRDIRDSAFKIIYESLLRDDPVDELFEMAEDIDEITVNDDVRQMVTDVLAKSEELDAMIAQYSKKRVFARIAKINVAILRIAFYEILYNDRIPTNSAVSEAVLLAQNYSYKEDVSFVNGILGAYTRSLEGENK